MDEVKREMHIYESRRIENVDGDCIICDAFRVEKYDESDNTYLITSLISEADGWLDYPESKAVVQLISNLIDLGIVPGVKSLFVNVEGEVEEGKIYYAALNDNASDQSQEFPTLKVKAPVLDVFFVLLAKNHSLGFLTANQNDQGVYDLSLTLSPHKAMKQRTVDESKEHLELVRKLKLLDETPLDAGIVYVLADRFEITYLGIE